MLTCILYINAPFNRDDLVCYARGDQGLINCLALLASLDTPLWYQNFLLPHFSWIRISTYYSFTLLEGHKEVSMASTGRTWRQSSDQAVNYQDTPLVQEVNDRIEEKRQELEQLQEEIALTRAIVEAEQRLADLHEQLHWSRSRRRHFASINDEAEEAEGTVPTSAAPAPRTLRLDFYNRDRQQIWDVETYEGLAEFLNSLKVPPPDVRRQQYFGSDDDRQRAAWAG